MQVRAFLRERNITCKAKNNWKYVKSNISTLNGEKLGLEIRTSKKFSFFLKKVCSHFTSSIDGIMLSSNIEQANAFANNAEMGIQLSSKIRWNKIEF